MGPCWAHVGPSWAQNAPQRTIFRPCTSMLASKSLRSSIIAPSNPSRSPNATKNASKFGGRGLEWARIYWPWVYEIHSFDFEVEVPFEKLTCTPLGPHFGPTWPKMHPKAPNLGPKWANAGAMLGLCSQDPMPQTTPHPLVRWRIYIYIYTYIYI